DADGRGPHHVAGDRDIAHALAEAGKDARKRRALDHVAGDRRVRLHRNADAAAVRTVAPQVADEIALTGHQPSAVFAVGYGNSARRVVDRVAGDDRAVEPVFRAHRDVAAGREGVAAHMQDRAV